jgi:hypothetical protein
MKEKAKKHKLFVKEMETSLGYLLKKKGKKPWLFVKEKGKKPNLFVKERERSYL